MDRPPKILKGVALGGWLMMEGYMLAGRNIPEGEFKSALEKNLGSHALDDFTRSFRDTFIRESDIKIIKDWGANCVRVPFNYRLAESEEGLKYLDRIVEWCGRHAIYCILDMHAAPGAQNPDWHADPNGEPRLFAEAANQERYLRLWRLIAGRYKDSGAVAGYDVLNEPVVEISREGAVRELYEKVTGEIRAAGSRQTIFLEGNDWGHRLEFLGKPADKNTVFSIHLYAPHEFVFNYVSETRYPGRIGDMMWDKAVLQKMAGEYRALAERRGVPVYVGEFGVNWRGGAFGEIEWSKDMLDIFEKNGFSWTYWTYKTLATPIFPDGIYRYTENPDWVNRKGPVTGWENFYTLWKTRRNDIIDSWKTENFERNDKLLSVLKKYF